MKINKPLRALMIAGLCCGLLSACGSAEFVDAEGDTFDWQDYQGQWLVVNFWAEWCAPCREEIPQLNQLDQQAGHQVLGVNFDRPERAELQRQMQSLDVQFRVVFSETGRRLADLTPQVLPTTYLFDQQGRMIKKLVGPQTHAAITAAFAAALTTTPNTIVTTTLTVAPTATLIATPKE